jgi:hypothetical protein
LIFKNYFNYEKNISFFSFTIGCNSENKGFDKSYFNSYWSPIFKYGDYVFPNVVQIQDSTLAIIYPASGQRKNKKFEVLSNDSLKTLWIYNKKQYHVKSKFLIISRDTFVTFDKRENPVDSFFRISKDEVERILEEWEGTLIVEPPRTN